MRFKGSINLMALKGAQVLNVTMPNGKAQACVVIPASYNDMVSKDGNVVPYLNLVAWEAKQSFIEACMARHAGEEGYVAPSHNIDMSMSQDFRRRAEEAAQKRILAENPTMIGDALKSEVTKATRISLGTLTPMETRIGYQAQGSVIASALPTTQAQSSEQAGQAPLPEDDLPF